jgi:hypothetical protein
MLTERAVTDWLDARAAEGWLVNYADLSVTGYPTAFRTEFEALELADPDTGWLWTLPAFRLESEACGPTASAPSGRRSSASPRRWNV